MQAASTNAQERITYAFLRGIIKISNMNTWIRNIPEKRKDKNAENTLVFITPTGGLPNKMHLVLNKSPFSHTNVLLCMILLKHIIYVRKNFEKNCYNVDDASR